MASPIRRSTQAVAGLPEVARDQGVAVAPIRRSHHCGAAGHPVERLAETGLVALLFANTPAAMAPWGGAQALLGTNPIAFACPLPGREPIVVDLSLSKVARGNILAAKQRGERIPEGWALDEAGRPTTDPDAALRGTMLPLGDAKGTALALMVELLAAGLTGATYAAEASSFLDAKGPPPGTGPAHRRLRSGGPRRRGCDRPLRGARRRHRGAGRRSPARRSPSRGAAPGADGWDRAVRYAVRRDRGALARGFGSSDRHVFGLAEEQAFAPNRHGDEMLVVGRATSPSPGCSGPTRSPVRSAAA